MIPINISALFILFLIIVFAAISTFSLIVLGILSFWMPDITLYFTNNKIKCIVFISLVVITDIFLVFVRYQFILNRIESERKEVLRESRRNFILQEPHQYGELLLPEGTRIKRRNPYDTGEENPPFSLSGLEYAEFPHPVKIAHCWASSIQTIGVLQLSKDQIISGIECKANQMAWFDLPDIEDHHTEFGKEKPDGPLAPLKPSQWTFRICRDK